MNDPGTPNLKKYVPVEDSQSPSYIIKGYSGGGHALNSKAGRAAQTAVVIGETLKWVNKHAPHTLPNWASGKPLKVDPEAGQDLNAYYYRQGLKFFYRGSVYTSMSSDVVAHELGHAVFDSYRPKSWDVADLEMWSFHEAFADISAILTVLQNEEIIQTLLSRKYLNRTNFISRIGEQIGKEIYKITKGKDGRTPEHLRNAATVFHYVNPSTLPNRSQHNRLSAEPHSFGRIMLSAFYQIFYNLYEYHVLRGVNQDHAIMIARNLLSKYLLGAIAIVPLKTNFFAAFAQSMLTVSVKTDHHKIMSRTFKKWNIINKASIKQIDIKSMAHTKNELEEVKLCNCMEMGTLCHNPLYEVDIEIPTDNKKRAVMSAKLCLDLLHRTNAVGQGYTTPFEIKNNKLVRTYI
tara:strand:+ start:890 stop:2104 length:1215 start_codon:yes stop_codon:yes gene_type:complete